MAPSFTHADGTATSLSVDTQALLTADELATFEATGEVPDFNTLAQRAHDAEQAELATAKDAVAGSGDTPGAVDAAASSAPDGTPTTASSDDAADVAVDTTEA